MKKATIILALAITAALTACRSQQPVLPERHEISWTAFCAARGYDLDDRTSEVSDEYLDTWRGSAEEEAAFIKAGVKSY